MARHTIRPLLPLLALLFTLRAVAQTTGVLRGTVKDPSGAVVPGAGVAAAMEETNVSRSSPPRAHRLSLKLPVPNSAQP